MPTTNNAHSNGEVTVTPVDKNRQLFQVPFHKDNTVALTALASAYGVNDAAIGRPLTVPQYLRTLALTAIMRDNTGAELRGFSMELEHSLESRNAIPKEIANWPIDLQQRIMALPDAATRKSAIALVQAEFARIAMMQSDSILSGISTMIATNPKSAAESK
jgi:hypothetical protein